MRIVYVPIRERIHSDRHTYRTYSICCLQETANRLFPICIFHDITLDRHQAQEIAHLCTDAQVESCHFMDIIYDLAAANSVCGFTDSRKPQAEAEEKLL